MAVSLILCASAYINGFSFLGFVAFFSAISIIFLPLKLRRIREDHQPEVVAAEATLSECYRPQELERIVAILKSGKSLLICGPQGCGKTALLEFVVEEMADYPHLIINQVVALKTMFTNIGEQLGIDRQSLEGKNLKTGELQAAIVEHLAENPHFIFCDQAEGLPLAFRRFLEELDAVKVPMLLVATAPQPKDIFLRLQRIELKPMPPKAIRAISIEYAVAEGFNLTPAQFSQVVARSGGLPMFAQRAVDEEAGGLKPNYDHSQFIDGLPYLLVFLLLFAAFRVVGRGMHNQSLYLIGGLATILVTVFRVLASSIPQRARRLG